MAKQGTARLAGRIAAALAKGRMPAMTAEIGDFLDDPQSSVLSTLRGLVAQAEDDAARGTQIASGYLYLLRGQLERIRYRRDRGYADAEEALAAFQRAVAAEAEACRVDGQMLALIGCALHDAGVEASAELRAAVAGSAESLVEEAPELPASLDAGIEQIADLLGGEPFAIVAMLAETGHAMPADTRAGMAYAFASGAKPALNEAGMLLALDALPVVREAAAAGLMARAAALSPAALRRLIAVRNWVPEGERARLDGVIRAARAAGVDCAAWPAGDVDRIIASAVDGSGAHGLLFVSPAGKRRILSSVLLKRGVRDAYSTPPETARAIERALGRAIIATPTLDVSREHADRLVRHHLAIGLDDNKPPAIGLLQVAETTGRTHWQPERIDWSAALAQLIAAAPAELRSAAGSAAMIDGDAAWASLDGFEESWFADDPETRKALRGRGDRVLVLLDSVLERHRAGWMELFGVTALWLQDASTGGDPRAPRFALVARAIAEGVPLRDVALMREIARRTVAVATLEKAGRR